MTDASDDVEARLPPARARFSLDTARAVVRSLPGFGRLLYRLVRDPRVSRLDRLLFAAAFLYLLTPVDVVPDWLPVMGQLDDLLVVGLALYRLLYRTPEEILLEHWDGEERALSVVRDLLDRIVGVVPWWGRRLLRGG